jgi:hypothetical protein
MADSATSAGDHLQHVTEGPLPPPGSRPPRHHGAVDRDERHQPVVVEVEDARTRPEDAGRLQERPGPVEQLSCGFLRGRIRTDDLPITSRMLGVDLVGSRRI